MANGAAIRVCEEEEHGRGWRFRVEASADGLDAEFHVTLSWADYDHWSRGAASPARVVEELVRFMLEREALDATQQDFDAARLRRRFDEVDETIRARL
ncbi:MAG: hypothetical protein AAGI30_06470 [Planctomycetota bacterium]